MSKKQENFTKIRGGKIDFKVEGPSNTKKYVVDDKKEF